MFDFLWTFYEHRTCIIEQEEKRRKDDASYFNIIAQIYKEALDTEKQRKKLGSMKNYSQ
jgi:hypothetical protein